MIHDPTEAVRRRELAEQQAPTNGAFAGFVTSTAFSISLSRRMVHALVTIDTAIAHKHKLMGVHVHLSNEYALVRRGLIERHPVWGEVLDQWLKDRTGLPELTWDRKWRLTRAGELMLDLLVEAQLVEPRALRHPLPPPPPGWLDPRPTLVMGHPYGAHLEPSARERRTP